MTDRSEKGRVMYLTPAGLKRVENGPDDLLGNEVCFYLKGYDDAPHAVYVAPLREGEPVPGTRMTLRPGRGDNSVRVVLSPPFWFEDGEGEECRWVRVRNEVNDKEWNVRVSDLTPLPKKKRPEEIATELHALIVNGEHRAHALVDELLEAARASLSVEEVGDA